MDAPARGGSPRYGRGSGYGAGYGYETGYGHDTVPAGRNGNGTHSGNGAAPALPAELAASPHASPVHADHRASSAGSPIAAPGVPHLHGGGET